MCEELARALRIRSFQWGSALRLSSQGSRNALDHRVVREKLRNQLDVSGIGFPMLRDHAREEGVRYEQYDRARTPACSPRRLDIGRSEIHGSRTAPALDWPSGHLST